MGDLLPTGDLDLLGDLDLRPTGDLDLLGDLDLRLIGLRLGGLLLYGLPRLRGGDLIGDLIKEIN